MVQSQKIVAGCLIDNDLLVGAQLYTNHTMRENRRLYGVDIEIGTLTGVGNSEAEAFDAVVAGTGQHIEESSRAVLVAIRSHLHNGIGSNEVGSTGVDYLTRVGTAILVLHVRAIEITTSAIALRDALVGHMTPVQTPDNCGNRYTSC